MANTLTVLTNRLVVSCSKGTASNWEGQGFVPEEKHFGTLLAFLKRASTAAIMSVFSERKSLAEGTEGWGSGNNGFVCRVVAIGIFALRA